MELILEAPGLSILQKITEKVYSALNQINQRPIRGEYKAWIYKFYPVLSLFFNLTVDHIPKSTINKPQTRASSFLKCWLNIPKCATLASLFNPEVAKFPHLPHVHEKAKLRLLASVHVSKDLNLKEMQSLISDPALGKRECIPPGCLNILPAHPPSTPPTVSVRSLMNSFNNTLIRQHTNHWNSHLESLSVQSKLLDIVGVENETHAWSRIMFSLPAGQMSFMIRAGIDCLPTPVNLCRWKIQSDTIAALSATLDLVQFTIFSIAVLQLSTKNATPSSAHW